MGAAVGKYRRLKTVLTVQRSVDSRRNQTSIPKFGVERIDYSTTHTFLPCASQDCAWRGEHHPGSTYTHTKFRELLPSVSGGDTIFPPILMSTWRMAYGVFSLSAGDPSYQAGWVEGCPGPVSRGRGQGKLTHRLKTLNRYLEMWRSSVVHLGPGIATTRLACRQAP